MTELEPTRHPMPLLHLYPTGGMHDEAFVLGTKEGLTLLRDALTKAIESGEKAESENVFSNDGEGYNVTVVPMQDDWGWPETSIWMRLVNQRYVDPDDAWSIKKPTERTVFPFQVAYPEVGIKTFMPAKPVHPVNKEKA